MCLSATGLRAAWEKRGSRPSCCSGRRVNKSAYAYGIEVEASYVMQ